MLACPLPTQSKLLGRQENIFSRKFQHINRQDKRNQKEKYMVSWNLKKSFESGHFSRSGEGNQTIFLKMALYYNFYI